MPKKFLDTDKIKWLELYESGKTEIQIAKEHAKCDLRTVRRGIEEARRRQDARIARAELIKEALRKHQDSLLKELDEILATLYLPTPDYVVLPWQRGGDFILTESESDVFVLDKVSKNEGGAVRQLLKEHLKNDRLWKVLAQWRKVYITHLTARTVLQGEIVAVVQEKTGCKLVEKRDSPRPFLYSYNTGNSIFRGVLQHAFGDRANIDLESDIMASTDSGDVRYHSLVLGEAPGNEEKLRLNLIEAFRELKGSSEAVSVVNTYKTLEETVTRVRQVVERIKLLGLIPGQCEICRRLGM